MTKPRELALHRKIVLEDPNNPGSLDLATYERFSRAARTISPEHAKIHDGNGYTASFVTSSDAIPSNGGKIGVLLFNPSSFSFPHLRIWEWDTEQAPANVALYENPTVAVTGTNVGINNMNRISSNVSSLTMFNVSSASDLGTPLLEGHLISGGKDTGGSHPNATIEWILAPATNYYFEFTNNTNNNTDVGFFAFWYV